MNMRWDFLARTINEKGYQSFCEIGTARGQNACTVLQKVNVPNFKLHTVDPYAVYDEFAFDEKNSANVQDDNEHRAAVGLKRFLENGSCEMIKEFSKEAAARFEDESLDAVFIDGNHSYEYVLEDMTVWYPKVRKGGLFSGHDYGSTCLKTCTRVVEAVDLWFKEKDLSFEVAENWCWWTIKE